MIYYLQMKVTEKGKKEEIRKQVMNSILKEAPLL